MFSITSTRIAGLVAVVCAVVVAPQALAATSIHSKKATPKVVPTVDAWIGSDLSGLGVSAPKVKTATTAAAIQALQRRSVAMDAAYRKLYPAAYRQAAQKSERAAVWVFPACGPSTAVEFDSYRYDSYSGAPCISTDPASTCIGVGVPPAAVTIEYRPEETTSHDSGCEG